jgi:hypothetical protein
MWRILCESPIRHPHAVAHRSTQHDRMDDTPRRRLRDRNTRPVVSYEDADLEPFLDDTVDSVVEGPNAAGLDPYYLNDEERSVFPEYACDEKRAEEYLRLVACFQRARALVFLRHMDRVMRG